MPHKFVRDDPIYHCLAPQVIEEVARVNGVTNVLGVELSQLTNDEERVGLNIESTFIDPTGSANLTSAWDVRELFRTPVLRRATISTWVV